MGGRAITVNALNVVVLQLSIDLEDCYGYIVHCQCCIEEVTGHGRQLYNQLGNFRSRHIFTYLANSSYLPQSRESMQYMRSRHERMDLCVRIRILSVKQHPDAVMAVVIALEFYMNVLYV